MIPREYASVQRPMALGENEKRVIRRETESGTRTSTEAGTGAGRRTLRGTQYSMPLLLLLLALLCGETRAAFLFPDMAYQAQHMRSGGPARYVFAALRQPPSVHGDGTGFLPDLLRALADRYLVLKNGSAIFRYEIEPVESWGELMKRAGHQHVQLAFGVTSPFLLRADDKFKDMHVSMATVQTSLKLVVPAHADLSQPLMGGAKGQRQVRVRGSPEERLLLTQAKLKLPPSLPPSPVEPHEGEAVPPKYSVLAPPGAPQRELKSPHGRAKRGATRHKGGSDALTSKLPLQEVSGEPWDNQGVRTRHVHVPQGSAREEGESQASRSKHTPPRGPQSPGEKHPHRSKSAWLWPSVAKEESHVQKSKSYERVGAHQSGPTHVSEHRPLSASTAAQQELDVLLKSNSASQDGIYRDRKESERRVPLTSKSGHTAGVHSLGDSRLIKPSPHHEEVNFRETTRIKSISEEESVKEESKGVHVKHKSGLHGVPSAPDDGGATASGGAAGVGGPGGAHVEVDSVEEGLAYVRSHAMSYLITDATSADSAAEDEEGLRAVCPAKKVAHSAHLTLSFFGRNAPLLKFVNDLLRSISQDGTLHALQARHFAHLAPCVYAAPGGEG